MLTLIFVVNLGVYLIQLLFAVPTQGEASPAGYISLSQLQAGHWWTVFTHLFVHLNIFHVATNMFGLWLVGRSVLNLVGPRHFLYLYFLGGWTGTALELFAGLDGDKHDIIGASGGVFSILGAFAVLRPEYSIAEPFRRWVGFRLRARYVIIGFILAEISLEIASRFIPSGTEYPGMNVAHLCHAGGGVFGLAYAMKIIPRFVIKPRPHIAHREWLLAPEEDEELPFVPAGRHRRSENLGYQQMVQQITPPEPVSNQEFLASTVNPILDKLHEKGIESLTAEEKNILKEAAKRLSQG